MLKKLLAKVNPFHAKPAPLASPPDPASTAAHPHSFSCACESCHLETMRLTAARLAQQLKR